ncbi:hypothetical protein C0Q70_19808 [Pomacea canaliculata]|uniref:NodB homology domain-containing protein n=1 Tax=Pomacea canaliculata TaxID=400727 RepID=A0A2T7NDS7_POMCA|nr:hypothetical protein C0Q70_19808 [Pomacea canaliculata]
MYLALGTLLSMAHMILPATACTQGRDCILPDCFCSTFDHPDFTDVKDIPQMVYFAFDDALNVDVDSYYQQVFTDTRLNPNGCPITMSLYVSHQNTDYSLVENHFQRGDDIGSHSVNHNDVRTAERLQFEAGQQKENLINNGHVARDQMVGWRSPNLQTAGDAQPDVLKALNYTYDISLTYVPERNNRIPWPYTLDFGYPYSCSTLPCPSMHVSHPGFWEIPVVALMDLESGFPCAYVDSCRPSSENAAFNYLWSNFEKPSSFGLSMHAGWFHTENYMKATQTFVERLLQLDDVYIISAKKVLDWMRNPVKVVVLTFFAFRSLSVQSNCSSRIVQYSNYVAFLFCDWTQRTTKLGNLVPSTTPVVMSASGKATTTKENVRATTVATTKENVKTTTAATTPLPVEVLVGNDSCVQGVNCVLPSCQCRSVNPPGQLSPDNTPQIVYFTVMGRVDVLTFEPLLNLLDIRQNPNNCSVSSTVFVPTTENFVPYLLGLLSRRHEVAMYGKEGYKYTPTPSVEEQVAEQLMQFATQINNIQLKPNAGALNRGWRSPINSVFNDKVLTALVKGGVQYDSSVTIDRSRPYKDLIPWPYTLDFGFQDVCSGSQSQCPVKRHPGLWEIPIVPLVDTKQEYTCTFVDACTINRPILAEETHKYLLNNFDFNYNHNRAPFGINIHRDWLSHPFYAENLMGLEMFLNTILKERPDTYVMSIEKMLEWMQNPTGLDKINSFLPWKCSS